MTETCERCKDLEADNERLRRACENMLRVINIQRRGLSGIEDIDAMYRANSVLEQQPHEIAAREKYAGISGGPVVRGIDEGVKGDESKEILEQEA